MKTQYYVGLDLGEKDDSTALAVLERFPCEADAGEKAELRLRLLERTSLGASYSQIVERVRDVLHSDPLRGRCELVVNATAAGQSALDLLQHAQLDCPIRPVRVTFAQSEKLEGDWAHIPNRDLLLGVHSLLLEGSLKFPESLPYAAELLRELPQVRITVTPSNAANAPWRERDYDDIVFALALACWGEKRGRTLPTPSTQFATATRPISH